MARRRRRGQRTCHSLIGTPTGSRTKCLYGRTFWTGPLFRPSGREVQTSFTVAPQAKKNARFRAIYAKISVDFLQISSCAVRVWRVRCGGPPATGAPLGGCQRALLRAKDSLVRSRPFLAACLCVRSACWKKWPFSAKFCAFSGQFSGCDNAVYAARTRVPRHAL